MIKVLKALFAFVLVVILLHVVLCIVVWMLFSIPFLALLMMKHFVFINFIMFIFIASVITFHLYEDGVFD